MTNTVKVALVHDWLLGMRGGERCLEVLCSIFPDADIYTAFYREEKISRAITSHQIFASPMNYLPFRQYYYRYLLPFYPLVARAVSRSIERRHVQGEYDLVISVSHCLAKNITVPKGLYHLCYCLTPMRYIWDKYDSYFAGHAFEPAIARVAHKLRAWDCLGQLGVDKFIAISEFVRKRINLVYGCDAGVVYPPVGSDWITPREANERGEGFLCVSALVPYKNVELIVKTFNELPFTLTVVGDGPLRKKLQGIAKENIRFLQHISDGELGALYRRTKALVFAAEEDFGMVPVEAQAAGRPVICYGKGGVLETVRGGIERPTGVFFRELTVDSLRKAVLDFLGRQEQFTVDNSLAQARRFSVDRFTSEFERLVEDLGIRLPEKLAALKVVGR
jgi:glycosyltransferase involved in cell wall biosynthesis